MMKRIKKMRFILISLALIAAANTDAQLLNNNAYLKNDYIQMALAEEGVYGAKGAMVVPPGYYMPDNAWNGPLGFICSPDNNWPFYYGDFMLPGTPYEGFSITFKDNSGNILYYENNRTSSWIWPSPPLITPLTPAFVYNSDTFMGKYDDVTWYGEISGYLRVECRFQLVGRRILHSTKLKNISGDLLTDIYFARGMDPDQENGSNSSGIPPDCDATPATYNFIESQADGTPGKVSWVTANGYCAPSSISLYSEDPNSRVGISMNWCDLLNTPAYAFGIGSPPFGLYLNEGEYSRTDREDWSIELVIFAGDLAPNDSVILEHEIRLDQPPVVKFVDPPLTLSQNEGTTFTYNLERQHQLDETVYATVRLTAISNFTAADMVGVLSLPFDTVIVFNPNETNKPLSFQATFDCDNINKNFQLQIVAVNSIYGGMATFPSIAYGTILNVAPVLPVIDPITGGTTVCLDQTLQLNNTTPGGVWKSADPAIATVNSTGLVSGLSAGMADIRYIVSQGCIDSVSTTVTVIDCMKAVDDDIYIFACGTALIDVLANDVFNGSPVPQLVATPSPLYGVASVVGDHIQYTDMPPCDAGKMDIFKYRIVGSTGSADTATVRVAILYIPQPVLTDSCSFAPKLVAIFQYDGAICVWEYSEDGATNWTTVDTNVTIPVTESGYYRITTTYKGLVAVSGVVKITVIKTTVQGGIWYETHIE